MRRIEVRLHSLFLVASVWLIGPTETIANPYRDAVLSDKPVAYYQFDEIDGSVAEDASENQLNGEYKGKLTLNAKSASPHMGTAVAFGGEKSRVHIPKHQTFRFGKGDFSVEFWFNCQETVGSRGDILSFKGEGKDFALFKAEGNANLLTFAVPARVFQAQTDPFSLGTWHHAVYVRRGNVDRWYIDGELSGTATGNVMDIDMKADILIGANHLNNPEVIADDCAWNGLIDELAFYNHALTAERVQAHFRAAKSEEDSERD
jgi:hypothetical protein